ncbi:MAG: hypothetical protein LBF79_00620, partial [Dysgonamonadaceae bacterium]|nr:hypothetical protein [Dysgonamonadaceae bacterium]
MNSIIESGMNTYTGNFNLLISVCTEFGPAYNPAPQKLTLQSLKEQSVHVRDAINLVDNCVKPALDTESARHKIFALLPPLATRVQAAATVLGLSEAVIVRIKEIVRKIRGKRKHKLKLETEENGLEIKKHISVSQRSFNEQIEHFTQIIALVMAEPLYTPTEDDLKVNALIAFRDKMGETNDAAVAASIPLANARIQRDELLFAPSVGMIDTALTVKEYVKSIFGAASPQYK